MAHSSSMVIQTIWMVMGIWNGGGGESNMRGETHFHCCWWILCFSSYLFSWPLLSGYFSLLEKLISSSCPPQNSKQMKRKTIYLSDLNSQLNWNMKGGNETNLYPSLFVCHSFLEAPFVPRRCPSLHWFGPAITNKQHKPFTRSNNSTII